MRGGARRLARDRLHDLSMTLSLAAVFIPVLFMGGILGRLLHEFAVTISGGDPGLRLRLADADADAVQPLPASRTAKRAATAASTQRPSGCSTACSTPTTAACAGVMRHRRATLAARARIAGGHGLSVRAYPQGLSARAKTPGQIFGVTEGGAGHLVRRDGRASAGEVADIIRHDPERRRTTSSSVGATGFSGAGNTGHPVRALKPRGERKLSVDQVIDELRPKLAAVPGIIAFLQNPPPIRIGGQLTKSHYQFTLQGPDTRRTLQRAPQILERKHAHDCRACTDVTSDLQISNPQVNVDIDRDKAHRARRLGADQIEDALYNAYGARQISTIYAPNNDYQVILEVVPQYQPDPATLAHALRALAQRASWCRSTRSREARSATSARSRSTTLGQLPSVTISFNLAPGRLARRRARRRQEGSRDDTRAGRPSAPRFQGTAAGVPVLAPRPGHAAGDGDPGHLHRARHSLRELHPPDHDSLRTAVRRLRRAAHAADLPHGADLYAFVGIIMLVGIVKKNAIMMIDFALEAQRTEGKSAGRGDLRRRAWSASGRS